MHFLLISLCHVPVFRLYVCHRAYVKGIYIFKDNLFSTANKITYATLLPFSVRIISPGIFLHTVRILVLNFLRWGKNFQCFKQEGLWERSLLFPAFLT